MQELKIINDVLIHEGNLLFLWQGTQKQFKYLTGEKEPTPQSIINFQTNVNNRKKHCESKGIEYYHIVYPSKPVAYQHKLANLNINSLYEKHYINDTVVYPKESLQKITTEGREAYKKNDTHLTDLGYINCIEQLLPKYWLNFIESGFDHIITEGGKLNGDLGTMVGAESDEFEETPAIYKTIDGLGYEVILKKSTNYQALKGNSGGICVFQSFKSITNKRVLIFGDSFIENQLRLLAPIFKEVIYFRSPFIRKELIHLLSPDIVITANAERYLSNVLSDEEAPFLSYEDISKTIYKNKSAIDRGFVDQIAGLSAKAYDTKKYNSFATNQSCSQANNASKIVEHRSLSYNLLLQEFIVGHKKDNSTFNSRLNDINEKLLQRKHSKIPIKLLPLRETKPNNGHVRSFAEFIYYNKKTAPTGQLKWLKAGEPIVSSQYNKLTPIILENIQYILNKSKNNLRLSNNTCIILHKYVCLLQEMLSQSPLKEEILEEIIKYSGNQGLLVVGQLLAGAYFFQEYYLVVRKYLITKECINQSKIRKNSPPEEDSFGEALRKYAIKKLANDENQFHLTDNDRKQILHLIDHNHTYMTSNTEIQSDDEQAFKSYIKGRSIAIVGPSPTLEHNGEVIDKYDIVIRMSPTLDNINYQQPKKYGSKVSIAYYSGHASLLTDEGCGILNVIDFACITLPKFAPHLFTENEKGKYEQKTQSIRATLLIKDAKRSLVMTTPNLLQAILLDIIRYQPKQISIFNCNLFSSADTYDQSYPSNKMLSDRLESKGVDVSYNMSSVTFLNHDPVSNFLLPQLLFEMKLIDGDRAFSELMKCTTQEYLNRLDVALKSKINKS